MTKLYKKIQEKPDFGYVLVPPLSTTLHTLDYTTYLLRQDCFCLATTIIDGLQTTISAVDITTHHCCGRIAVSVNTSAGHEAYKGQKAEGNETSSQDTNDHNRKIVLKVVY